MSMNNNVLQIKIKERLNKLSSHDYDNLECWQIAEAMNKAQLEWVRRQLHGSNLFREGDEQSIRRIDDLQILLTSIPIRCTRNDNYYQSMEIPEDYLGYKRMNFRGSTDKIKERPFVVYLTEEAHVDILSRDPLTRPDIDWAETFCTIADNKIRIYTNGLFTVTNPYLVYYRMPRPIQFKGCSNLETGKMYIDDQTCEFKADIVELIIDEAASTLAGDMEAMLQVQRNTQNAERNN